MKGNIAAGLAFAVTASSCAAQAQGNLAIQSHLGATLQHMPQKAQVFKAYSVNPCLDKVPLDRQPAVEYAHVVLDASGAIQKQQGSIDAPVDMASTMKLLSLAYMNSAFSKTYGKPLAAMLDEPLAPEVIQYAQHYHSDMPFNAQTTWRMLVERSMNHSDNVLTDFLAHAATGNLGQNPATLNNKISAGFRAYLQIKMPDNEQLCALSVTGYPNDVAGWGQEPSSYLPRTQQATTLAMAKMLQAVQDDLVPVLQIMKSEDAYYTKTGTSAYTKAMVGIDGHGNVFAIAGINGRDSTAAISLLSELGLER